MGAKSKCPSCEAVFNLAVGTETPDHLAEEDNGKGGTRNVVRHGDFVDCTANGKRTVRL